MHILQSVLQLFFSFSFIIFLFFFCSLSSRHQVWRSLKFLMMLNSSDLLSSASVKSSRASKKGLKQMVLHSWIVVSSKRPLLPKRGRGGGRRWSWDVKLAGLWHYCRMHEDHIETRLSSSQESHLKRLQCAYTVNGRTDAISYMNS